MPKEEYGPHGMCPKSALMAKPPNEVAIGFAELGGFQVVIESGKMLELQHLDPNRSI